MSIHFIFSVFIVLSIEYYGESLQCRDESGKIVDWFVLYKLPKIHHSENRLIREGVAYLFITNESLSDGWKLSEMSMNDDSSIPGQTLTPSYKDSIARKSAWIVYNDQPPSNRSSPSSKYGHAKGVVMANRIRGFWLIHSVPNFPPMPNSGVERKYRPSNNDKKENIIKHNDIVKGKYAFPTTGHNNGQSFLCISVGSSQIDTVTHQLIYNQIISYKYNVPTTLSQYSSFIDASKRRSIKLPPFNNKAKIESMGGHEFVSFAKADKWDKDLYDDFVAPQLQSDLLAETWLNGRGKLPSECNDSKVLNVESVILPAANVEFRSSRDHSKWAVATDNKENQNWVCIGDINRADTQFRRGGGTVCTNSPKLWKNYRTSVNAIEPCPRKKGIVERVKYWFKKSFGK